MECLWLDIRRSVGTMNRRSPILIPILVVEQLKFGNLVETWKQTFVKSADGR